MYPLSFQFNEDMLTYIGIHVYSRKYGNFLYLTRAIGVIYKFNIVNRCTKTSKIWLYMVKNIKIKTIIYKSIFC